MQNNDFYTLITAAGRALEVQAKASNIPFRLARMAVGDGGGAAYNPTGAEEALRSEKWRGNLNALLPHPENPAWLIAECILPDQEGGWWIREAGLLTETGVLYAIAKYPDTFKPVLASGAGKMLYIRMIFEVSNAASVTLQVDPAVVLATRAALQSGLDTKLGKTETASAAHQLAAPRYLSLTGAVTAPETPFDGSSDLTLAVAGLDMNKASAGLLSITHGGTGLGAVAAGAYLMGTGANSLAARTPTQVSNDIGVPNAIADALHEIGLGAVSTTPTVTNLDDPTLAAGLYCTTGPAAQGNWVGDGIVLHKIYGTAGFQLANQHGSEVLRFRERAAGVWRPPITLANLDSPSFTDTPRAVTPAASDNSTRLATTEFVANHVASYGGLPVYSINALPTKNVGMIIVREFGETWHWVQWAKFVGYRSKNCGQIGYFHALDPQPGWLKANGAAVSCTYYAGLNAMLDGQYGYTEDGEKFYLPDHRGEFIRGYDDGRGVDPGHLLGTTQAATAIRALLDNYTEPPGVPYPAGTLAVGMRNTDGRLLGAGSDTTVGNISTYYRVGNVLPLAGWEDNRSYFTRPRNFALSAFIKF